MKTLTTTIILGAFAWSCASTPMSPVTQGVAGAQQAAENVMTQCGIGSEHTEAQRSSLMSQLSNIYSSTTSLDVGTQIGDALKGSLFEGQDLSLPSVSQKYTQYKDCISNLMPGGAKS